MVSTTSALAVEVTGSDVIVSSALIDKDSVDFAWLATDFVVGTGNTVLPLNGSVDIVGLGAVDPVEGEKITNRNDINDLTDYFLVNYMI